MGTSAWSTVERLFDTSDSWRAVAPTDTWGLSEPFMAGVASTAPDPAESSAAASCGQGRGPGIPLVAVPPVTGPPMMTAPVAGVMESGV